MIILVIIALLILSYFGFNLRNLVNAPTTQDNFSYTSSFVVGIWNDYLKAPLSYIWNQVFIPLIWNPFIDNLTKMKNNQPTNVELSAPSVVPPGAVVTPVQ